MEISDVELFEVPAAAVSGDCSVTLLCLTTRDGKRGWGEVALGWQAKELPGRRQMLLAELAGRSIFDVAERSSASAARPNEAALRCAVETAMWDAIGRTFGEPLCHLWGGIYRPQVPLATRIDAGEALANPHIVSEKVEHGFHEIMLACTGDVARDVDAVRSVQRAMGHTATLSLDGRERFTPDAALRLAGEVPEESVRMLLDPVAGDNLAAVGGLARLLPMPMGLCRCIRKPEDVMAIIRTGGVQSVALDAIRLGGILATRRAVAVAAAGSLTTSLWIPRSLGIHTAATLHLAASEVALDQHHFYTGNPSGSHSPVAGIRIVDGMAEIPRRAGLGIRVHRDETHELA